VGTEAAIAQARDTQALATVVNSLFAQTAFANALAVTLLAVAD
jgi:hypothetical protein